MFALKPTDINISHLDREEYWNVLFFKEELDLKRFLSSFILECCDMGKDARRTMEEIMFSTISYIPVENLQDFSRYVGFDFRNMSEIKYHYVIVLEDNNGDKHHLDTIDDLEEAIMMANKYELKFDGEYKSVTICSLNDDTLTVNYNETFSYDEKLVDDIIDDVMEREC